MARVELRNIRKSFGQMDVIHDVSISIGDGEFVVLVGPSGCGKSTLLRMLAGLDQPSSGQILIGSSDVTHKPAKERDVAMVFQSYALYPHMTVRQNMGFSLQLRGDNAESIAAKVAAAADVLGLTPYLDRKPAALSGGQRQRVAMGRAIVRAPQVFLFDEPLSNLDAKLRVQMRSEIKALRQRLGTTTVYVTHDQTEAMTMADKIVVLRAGRVEQIGAPLELFDRPDNTFVAGFIGSPEINLFPGRIEKTDAGVSFVFDNGGRAPVAESWERHAGRETLLGVRPEYFQVAGLDEGLPVEIEVVEPLGTQVQLVLRHDGAPISAVFSDRLRHDSGQRLHLLPRPELALLFDAETGRRIAPD